MFSEVKLGDRKRGEFTLSACSNASQRAKPTSLDTSQFVPEPSLKTKQNKKKTKQNKTKNKKIDIARLSHNTDRANVLAEHEPLMTKIIEMRNNLALDSPVLKVSSSLENVSYRDEEFKNNYISRDESHPLKYVNKP